MLWFAYNVLFVIGYLLLLPRFAVRMLRRGGYGKGFLERFAVYRRPVAAALAAGRPWIWVHGVSVGEVYVALKFIEELRRREEGLRVVLSTTTSTGHAVAEGALLPGDVLLYYPADLPFIVRRALAAIRPRVLLLVEGELWPNMIRSAAARGVPVVLLNGRLSESSCRGYRLLKPFFRRAMEGVRLLLVQGRVDAERFRRLGVADGRIAVLGTAKYDVATEEHEACERAARLLAQCGMGGDALVLLGGSTWPGEEAALLALWRRLRSDYPGLKLVLVPRHAERGDAVAAELDAAGVSWLRRSSLRDEGSAARADVLLVDTTGELRGLYGVAAVIFVGKSLTRHGGQNPIEPALLGKPVLVGPNMENFPAVMAEFRERRAVIQVADAAELEREARRLLGDAGARAELGRRARAAVVENRGVVARSVDRVMEVLAGCGARGAGPPAAPRSAA